MTSRSACAHLSTRSKALTGLPDQGGPAVPYWPCIAGGTAFQCSLEGSWGCGCLALPVMVVRENTESGGWNKHNGRTLTRQDGFWQGKGTPRPRKRQERPASALLARAESLPKPPQKKQRISFQAGAGNAARALSQGIPGIPGFPVGRDVLWNGKRPLCAIQCTGIQGGHPWT
jgi:hypothetical protein